MKLDGAGRDVPRRAGEGHRLGAHPLAQRRVDERRRRLLEHLLVAALHGALALAEVEHVAVPVGEHLDLDVPGALDVALDEHPPVPEARERLVRRAAKAVAHLVLAGRDPHPLAPAAGRGLDHHRVADLARDGHRLVGAGKRPVHPGDRVHPRLGGEPAGLDLVPHRADRGRRRPDEGDPRRLEGGHERSVLGEEAEAGVHRVRPGRAGRLHHRLDVEVALCRGRRADAHRPVRHAHVRRALVRLGVDGGRRDPEAPRGARDPARDLAPVRDEDAPEAHGLASGPPAARAHVSPAFVARASTCRGGSNINGSPGYARPSSARFTGRKWGRSGLSDAAAHAGRESGKPAPTPFST